MEAPGPRGRSRSVERAPAGQRSSKLNPSAARTQALLYGGLGMALAALRKIPLSYGGAVSVAIMALTPVIILDALLVWTNTYLPLWGFGSFLLALGYLVFGIRSAARSNRSHPVD